MCEKRPEQIRAEKLLAVSRSKSEEALRAMATDFEEQVLDMGVSLYVRPCPMRLRVEHRSLVRVLNRSNSCITMRVAAKESPGGACAHLSAQCVPQVVCMVVCMVQHMQEPTAMLGQYHGRECDLRILWERMQVLCPTGLRRRSKVDRESARREPSSL